MGDGAHHLWTSVKADKACSGGSPGLLRFFECKLVEAEGTQNAMSEMSPQYQLHQYVHCTACCLSRMHQSLPRSFDGHGQR
jgi:hypothetical protein